jgi:hypothetical protein
LKSNKKLVGADGLLGILQHGDGTLSIFTKLQDNEEFTPDMSLPRAFGFRNAADASQVRDGALIRLGAKKGHITGKSLGQVVAAVRAEANALGLVAVPLAGADSQAMAKAAAEIDERTATGHINGRQWGFTHRRPKN